MVDEIELSVVSSPIKFGGRARVNEKTLDETRIDEGSLVVISSDKRDILLTIYSDLLIDEGLVKLREDDMRKLGVKEGAVIKMKKHSSLLKNKPLDNLL